ncbi:NifB/NifX family molybdenum-iron cluster-binding protein [Geoglobus acetivorans]|uniref:Dinitrogenase iron-molybdenum cofactor biosynthesis domain-containing protein n=1 Tax=Geoglobus acetivorans TaxID=565033 RepID=A0A0A7GDH3_GEOAI|nr:hypothetical protein GACE_1071 [Geoglobus acetivorans]
MIVAIPTDDGKRISAHFGRARYIYITDGKNAKLAENPHRGHAGRHEKHRGKHELANLLTREGVEVVYALHVGEGMRRNLGEAGIKIETVKEMDIEKLLHGHS